MFWKKKCYHLEVSGKIPGSLVCFWVASGRLFQGLLRKKNPKSKKWTITCHKYRSSQCKASFKAKCDFEKNEEGFKNPSNWITIPNDKFTPHLKLSTNSQELNALFKIEVFFLIFPFFFKPPIKQIKEKLHASKSKKWLLRCACRDYLYVRT